MDIYVSYTCLKITSVFHITLNFHRIYHLHLPLLKKSSLQARITLIYTYITSLSLQESQRQTRLTLADPSLFSRASLADKPVIPIPDESK